jgi:hypothetical protein
LGVSRTVIRTWLRITSRPTRNALAQHMGALANLEPGLPKAQIWHTKFRLDTTTGLATQIRTSSGLKRGPESGQR